MLSCTSASNGALPLRSDQHQLAGELPRAVVPLGLGGQGHRERLGPAWANACSVFPGPTIGQIGLSTAAAAVDFKQRYVPARDDAFSPSAPNYVPKAINSTEYDILKTYGLHDEAMSDPARSFEPFIADYNTGDPLLHAYAYFGGVNWWRNVAGSFQHPESRSPVTLDDSTSEIAIVADCTMRVSGVFGNPDLAVGTEHWLVDIPAHGHAGDAQRTPLGGNHVFADGSGTWVPWSGEWRRLHSWNTNGTRDLFWFQEDVGDLENETMLQP